MMPAMTRGDSELPINGMRITLGRFSGSGEGNLGKGRLPSTSDSPCRPRRSLNSALSGTSCLVGVALLGISAVALVALRAHQHPPEHAGVGLMHGLASQGRDVAQRDIVRTVVEIHRLWSDDAAASSNYSLATAAANANATLSDSRATLDLAGAGTNASKLNVSTPYRWLIQNLLGITYVYPSFACCGVSRGVGEGCVRVLALRCHTVMLHYAGPACQRLLPHADCESTQSNAKF